MTKRTKRIADFTAIVAMVAIADLLAKELAAALLAAGPMTIEAFGRALRLVLVHNELSAFGVSLGPLTREINVAATSAALLLAVPACGRLRLVDPLAPLALGLIAGAALGNLLSMLVAPAGVVDFIAVPVGGGTEIVCNLADIAAYLGLLLLARPVVTLCRLIRVERRAAAQAR